MSGLIVPEVYTAPCGTRVLVQRERSAALVNLLANNPAVHSGLPVYGPLNFTPAVRGAVILSNGASACAVFEWISEEERSWEAHTLFGPACRGRLAIATAQCFLQFMWRHANAAYCYGSTPLSNRAARWFNRQIGAVAAGVTQCPVQGPCETFVITRPE